MSVTAVTATPAVRDLCSNSRRRRSSDLRHVRGSSLEVTDVVHAADDKTPVALLDHRHRGVLNPEWKDAATGSPHHLVQRDLNHASVRDHEYVTLLVAVE